MIAALLALGCSGRPNLETLRDPEACAACHPVHVEQWRGSMHAYASTDPLFRALNARGQRETNGELGDFCVRCHAPLAVELGLTTDGLDLDDVPEELQGVNCYFCHSVSAVDGTHNNPLQLTHDGVMRGGIADPVRNSFHASRYSPLLDRDDAASAQACGACHDIVAPSGAHIERTYLEWRESVYDRDDVAFQRLTCGNCHMEGDDRPVAELAGSTFPVRRLHGHAWPAVDIALTDFPGRDVQRALVQDALDDVINPQLCVTVDPVGLETSIVADLENLAAGHAFPSGAAADRRVWVELVAYQGGEEVWRTGHVEPGVAMDDTPDPDRWSFGDRHFDATGGLTHFFWEVETVASSLLPAPTAFSPTDPDWTDTHRARTWVVEGVQADRVTLAMHLRPYPLDVARRLVEEEGLDPGVVDAIPTFTLGSAALEWSVDLGRACVR
ncbi:MAG: hypothetical protein H6736_17285 [Alphaproteobacteria bacterium]|nr:hypothetical protein [Alphaproteobacteria bacterium]MCB9693568.1 hypothetical protein [Alphaproteobacteria bacterium]